MIGSCEKKYGKTQILLWIFLENDFKSKFGFIFFLQIWLFLLRKKNTQKKNKLGFGGFRKKKSKFKVRKKILKNLLN